jgi:hypothetical protein
VLSAYNFFKKIWVWSRTKCQDLTTEAEACGVFLEYAREPTILNDKEGSCCLRVTRKSTNIPRTVANLDDFEKDFWRTVIEFYDRNESPTVNGTVSLRGKKISFRGSTSSTLRRVIPRGNQLRVKSISWNRKQWFRGKMPCFKLEVTHGVTWNYCCTTVVTRNWAELFPATFVSLWTLSCRCVLCSDILIFTKTTSTEVSYNLKILFCPKWSPFPFVLPKLWFS